MPIGPRPPNIDAVAAFDVVLQHHRVVLNEAIGFQAPRPQKVDAELNKLFSLDQREDVRRLKK